MIKNDEKTRKMLMTVRAGLLMAAKAIEEYCREEPTVVKTTEQDTVTLT